MGGTPNKSERSEGRLRAHPPIRWANDLRSRGKSAPRKEP